MSWFLTGPGVDIYLLFSVSLSPIDPALLAVLSSLVGLGVLDKVPMLGDDDDEGGDEDDDDSTGDDDAIFEDDEMGDLDDEFDEGGFDDDFDDGGSDSDASELEPRIEELEDEVASVSSTVSTVRSENEAISDTVEEVEENVRKLLDIYEMVTRGVNPFVEEGGGDAFDGDSLGLFGDEDSDDGSEPADDEVMDADADSFFDDEFDDMDDGLDEEADESFDDGELEDDDLDLDEGDDGGSGKTFDELKAEYDSGDAEWDEEDVEGELEGGDAELEGDEDGFEFEQDESEDDSDDMLAEEDTVDEEVILESNTDSDGAEAEGTVSENGSASENGKKPYLTDIPAEYSADMIVMEWMSYLRDHADTAETLRAIEFYRNIDWINDQVAEDLTEVVRGFEENGHNPSGDDTNISELTIDHHTHSLEYISQLDESTIDIDQITNWPVRGD